MNPYLPVFLLQGHAPAGAPGRPACGRALANKTSEITKGGAKGAGSCGRGSTAIWLRDAEARSLISDHDEADHRQGPT
jgi:hypothetical protein